MKNVATVVGGLIAAMSMAASAQATTTYRFTKVVDSFRDDFDPGAFTCSAIDKHGDIAFKAGRTQPDFSSIDGIYRVNANGTLTVIAEDPDRVRFNVLSNFPAMNDHGDVSFAASLAGSDDEAILRGDGGPLTTIATTTTGPFRFLGFETSINAHGEVAFPAQLDTSEIGLFSGSGGGVTTHDTNSGDVRLDHGTGRFFGTFDRPSINAHGDIAFHEFLIVDDSFSSGAFVGQNGRFATFSDDLDVRSPPVLNDHGVAAFEASHFDEDGNFVDAIVKSDGRHVTTVADTAGGDFGFFGFRPPAINKSGDVAFFAFTGDFSGSAIFVNGERVIGTGDTLDGVVLGFFDVSFCEEGLNDGGELSFIARLADDSIPATTRTIVVRATPVHP